MNRLILFTILFLLTGNFLIGQSHVEIAKSETPNVLMTIDTNLFDLVKLPSPNSYEFSFEEAAARKEEIYDMQLSVKYFGWKNPTSGGALHITKNDEIEVYQFTFGMMFLRDGEDENGNVVRYVTKAPKDTSYVIHKKDILNNVGGIGEGNHASVLITSEYDLKKSTSIKLILEEVFRPSMQIYYLKKK